MTVTIEGIERAAGYLRDHVAKTPVEASSVGMLKLENRQVTGSFKVRGALWKLASTPATAVAAASAGNHGLGLAYAARLRGVHATIYVPSTVDAAKARGIEALGATLVRSPYAGYDDTAAWGAERAASDGLSWVSAYEDPDVIAGNGGSLALEVLDQVPDLDTIVIPTGGGGMLAGVVVALAARRPGVRIIAVQHEGCPALAWSLARGAVVTRTEPFDTAAGGLEGGFGALNFDLVRGRVETASVTEAQLFDSMRFLWDDHREVAEPSGAAAIAAVRAGLVEATPRTVVVITGRNVARATLGRALQGAPGAT